MFFATSTLNTATFSVWKNRFCAIGVPGGSLSIHKWSKTRLWLFIAIPRRKSTSSVTAFQFPNSGKQPRSASRVVRRLRWPRMRSLFSSRVQVGSEKVCGSRLRPSKPAPTRSCDCLLPAAAIAAATSPHALNFLEPLSIFGGFTRRRTFSFSLRFTIPFPMPVWKHWLAAFR